MVYSTHPNHLWPGRHAHNSMRDLADTVRDTVKALKPHCEEFDCIVVMGVSGLAVGAPVAVRMKKTLLVLRKETENCHAAPGSLVGAEDAKYKRVLFLDDFVSQGHTKKKCISAVEEACGTVVAEFQYDRYGGYRTLV